MWVLPVCISYAISSRPMCSDILLLDGSLSASFPSSCLRGVKAGSSLLSKVGVGFVPNIRLRGYFGKGYIIVGSISSSNSERPKRRRLTG